jgi:hypothetical protein
MIFWESCEAHKDVFDNVVRVGKMVEIHLNKEFSNSILIGFPLKIRYIPIIMPPKNIDNYPSRSKYRVKQNIYDCAPQLDYRIFLDKSLKCQIFEYLNGLLLSNFDMSKFGATFYQIDAYNRIIENAARVLSDFQS